MRPSQIKVCILEPCMLMRLGIEASLKRLNNFKLQFIEVSLHGSWPEQLISIQPDVIIVNPCVLGVNCSLSDRLANSKVIAFEPTPIADGLLRGYAGRIRLNDDLDQIKMELDRILMTPDERAEDLGREQQMLTPREKEIVICVVKGLTNKEIADTLGLSTHTVITHRRNIAKKLQIHSPSGLTIYAIMNKLVDLSEVAQKN